MPLAMHTGYLLLLDVSVVAIVVTSACSMIELMARWFKLPPSSPILVIKPLLVSHPIHSTQVS